MLSYNSWTYAFLLWLPLYNMCMILQHLLLPDKLLMSLRILVQSGDTDTSLQLPGFVGCPVGSGGADTNLYLYSLFARGQLPWNWSIYTVIVIYKMTNPWSNVMKTCLTDDHLFSC